MGGREQSHTQLSVRDRKESDALVWVTEAGVQCSSLGWAAPACGSGLSHLPQAGFGFCSLSVTGGTRPSSWLTHQLVKPLQDAARCHLTPQAGYQSLGIHVAPPMPSVEAQETH